MAARDRATTTDLEAAPSGAASGGSRNGDSTSGDTSGMVASKNATHTCQAGDAH